MTHNTIDKYIRHTTVSCLDVGLTPWAPNNKADSELRTVALLRDHAGASHEQSHIAGLWQCSCPTGPLREPTSSALPQLSHVCFGLGGSYNNSTRWHRTKTSFKVRPLLSLSCVTSRQCDSAMKEQFRFCDHCSLVGLAGPFPLWDT